VKIRREKKDDKIRREKKEEEKVRSEEVGEVHEELLN